MVKDSDLSEFKEQMSSRRDLTISRSLTRSGLATFRSGPYGTMSDEERKETEVEREVGGIESNYDVSQLITFNVFGFFRGTVLQSKVLWQETLILAFIYWAVFSFGHMSRLKGISDISGKEDTIRAFISMFSTLIGLLLSFFTALNLGSWWQMRMSVQHIIESSKRLSMMVGHGVSQDPVLLEKINRYSRTSLFLIFAGSQMKEGEDRPVQKAFTAGLLTQEEVDKLDKANAHMVFVQAETLYIWQANWVTRMHEQGLTKGNTHYAALMAAIEEGRSGVADVQATLETQIPFGYVHLLCIMVKLHNLIVTILMAFASVMLAGGHGIGGEGFQTLGVVRTAFRAFFMPFLYNAILIINSEVTDPFSGDDGDFDWSNYDMNLMMSGRAYGTSASNLPKVIKEWDGKKEKV